MDETVLMVFVYIWGAIAALLNAPAGLWALVILVAIRAHVRENRARFEAVLDELQAMKR